MRNEFSITARSMSATSEGSAQYCYPTGTCNLSNLHDGIVGFMLQGVEYNGDSGSAVSGAGDVNGDDIADFIIGARGEASDAGRSYVIFGSNQVNAWGNGSLSLNSLANGQRGFAVQGETAGDHSGQLVSVAGDMNGDGLADIAIGAYTAADFAGESYVILGSNQANAWGNGSLGLGSLMDGERGFALVGEADDWSGFALSTAGDINGDGLTDLIIGTWLSKSYVVFGSNQTGAWGNGRLNISDLTDGQRGFLLQGELSEYAGYSVGTAGDVNGDNLADVIIGGYVGPYGAGKSFIVFGSNQPNAWGNGTLSLNSLMDSERGFVLVGEADDWVSFSVNTAGDINGDGFDDVIIGSYPSFESPGKSFVVLGSNQTGAWGNGTVNLYSLMDGEHGFVLQGEIADLSGVCVGSAGDINGDSMADMLIGAVGAAQSAGKTYVIFGSNQANAWGNGTLSLSSLANGERGFALQGETRYDSIGYEVSSAGDINSDGLPDLLIGDQNAAWGKGASYIVFGAVAPQLVMNQLTIGQGQIQILDNQNLNATNRYPVSYSVSNVTHGQFEAVAYPGQSITDFNQSAVWEQQVRFVHDGSAFLPSYDVQTLSEPGIASLSLQAANITFYYAPVVAHVLPDQNWDLDQVFNFTVPTSTFTDPNNFSLVLSATLADGNPLPNTVNVTNASDGLIFEGVMDKSTNWKISVVATNTANVSTPTYFKLASILSSNGIDPRILAAVLVAVGGVLAGASYYLYKRVHQQKRRETEDVSLAQHTQAAKSSCCGIFSGFNGQRSGTVYVQSTGINAPLLEP